MQRKFFLGLIVLLAYPFVAASEDLELPKELASYHDWRVFKNIPLPDMIATRCFVPPIEWAYLKNQKSEKGPHKSKFISVYLSPTAQEVVQNLRKVKFPSGSVIVKEKKAEKEGPALELGAMIKLASGA
jgi:hypothetical protein